MNILVECHHTLGDVIMTLPALKMIARAFPEARIDYLAGMDMEIPVLKSTGQVNRVYVLNVKKNSYRDMLRLVSGLRKNRYDLGVSFGESKKGLDVLLLKLAGCKRILGENKPEAVFKGYSKVDVSGIKHRIFRHMKVAESLGPVRETSLVTLDGIKGDGKEILLSRGACPGKKKIGLVVGTGDFMYRRGREIVEYNTKSWGKEKFLQLADKLTDEGYEPVILGGVKEQDLFREYSREKNFIDLAGKLDIISTIAVMKECEAVVGGDSGPMHCAAAAGVPTVTLFGPTDSDDIGPLGGRAVYIYGDCDCSRCYSFDRKKGEDCRDHRCMKSINPQMVWEETEKLLKKDQ